jgi:vanillate O-demethylase monooxygenase subunit
MSQIVANPPSAVPDMRALRACWHPVAFASELGDAPFGARLLGEPVVVWRGDEGRLHAVKDLCIHRGTALSLG